MARHHRTFAAGVIAAISVAIFSASAQSSNRPDRPDQNYKLFGKKEKPSDTSRTIRGQILDESGSSVTGAVIKLKNVANGSLQNAITSSTGKFEFRELNANEDYEVTVSQRGSNDVTRKVSRFDSRKLIEMHVRLEKKDGESRP